MGHGGRDGGGQARANISRAESRLARATDVRILFILCKTDKSLVNTWRTVHVLQPCCPTSATQEMFILYPQVFKEYLRTQCVHVRHCFSRFDT